MDIVAHVAQLVRQGNAEQALREAQQATQEDPQSEAAWIALGFVKQKLGTLQESLAALDRALALNQDNAFAWEVKAVTVGMMREGHEREALAAADRALALNPGLAEANYVRALSLNALDQTAAALAAFNRTLEINPRHVDALADKALTVMMALKQFQEGYQLAWQATQIDAQNVKGWRALGLAQFALAQYTAAIHTFDFALSLSPDDAMCYMFKGSCYREMQQFDAAIAIFDEGLKFDPQDEMLLEARKESVDTRNRVRLGKAANAARAVGRGIFSLFG